MNFRALTLLLALGTTALAQQKRPMTFADLQAMHRIADPQISPSGKWVLFSVTDADLAKNTKNTSIWAVPLDGSAKEHIVTLIGSDARFSPDGKSLLFVYDGSVFLAQWDDVTGNQAGEARGIRTISSADGLLWAPDSKHFLFAADVFPECESHELRGPSANQNEQDCNAQKDAEASKDAVQARIFTSLLYRHWNQYMGPKHSHIFYASIDPRDGPPTDLTPASVIGDHEAPTFSLGGPLGYAISPDGKEIAYVTNLDPVPAESTNNDIFVLDPTADPHTAKKVSTSPGSDDGPQYSPDGKYLAWRSQARNGYESDKFDLVVMNRSTSSIKNLTAKFDGWVDEFTWLPNSNSLLFASATFGHNSVYQLSLGDNTLTQRTDGTRGFEMKDIALVQDGKHLEGAEYSDLGVSPDGRTLIASFMSVRAPSEIASLMIDDRGEVDDTLHQLSRLAYDGNARTLRYVLWHEQKLSHLNDGCLSQLDLPAMESFTFPGANNTKVQGFLIRPPNFDPNKKYPLKFLIHGGPQGAWGDAWSYRWNPELFAANGYVVVMINPRGSTGYGQKFLEQVSGDWGGRPYQDLMKGLDFAEAKYPFIDKTRECALGASYGGFMADYILTHTTRFACIVTHDGMYNPQSAFGTTEELWFNEWEFRPLATRLSSKPYKNLSSRPERSAVERPASDDAQTTTEATVETTNPAHPWDFYDLPADQDPFRKFSPMLAIKNAKTPTLVIHGQKDYRLDVSEGLQLFTALQLLHVPSKMLYFPDEGHWVLKPQNSRLWYETVNDWCDKYTHTNDYAP